MSGMMDEPGLPLEGEIPRMPGLVDNGDFQVEANEPQEDEPTEAMRREQPDPDAARRALVERFGEEIAEAREKYAEAFDRMRSDMDFTWGKQWPEEVTTDGNRDVTWGLGNGYYTVNVTGRHVQNRVATLYARNPRPAVKPKKRLMSQLWDGTPGQLAMAQQRLQMIQEQQTLAQQAQAQGLPAEMAPPDPTADQIVKDFQLATMHRAQVTRFAKTQEILLEYFIGEQALPFKAQMKRCVRRAVTCGVAWVKPGFTRGLDMRPDLEARINDLSTRLANVERLSAELADGQVDRDAPEAEELRLALASLKRQKEVLVREGLTFDFPPATSILPDARCKQLAGFLGCDWVAQEYVLSPEKVMEIYGVDPRSQGYTGYRSEGKWEAGVITKLKDGEKNGEDQGDCRVYQIYRISDGLIYHFLEGYPDFLKEPAPPEFLLERFWPWYSLTFNEVEHYEEIFPPSDVTLIRDPQLDINRSRQGLREHRVAARPKMAAQKGRLDAEDKEALQTHPQDGIAIIELNALSEGQSVSDILQPLSLPGIDPNLYDPSPQYQDVLRVVGTQEANLGGPTGKGTATETAIAESSRMSAAGSSVDDLDEFLGEVTHGASQILLSMMSEDQVKLIVGPGALWPQLTRQEIAAEVMTTVEAGSTGRPNKAAKIADFQSLAPFLMQTPGIRPEKLTAFMVRLLDDNIEMEDFLDPNLPSIMAMNSLSKPVTGDPGNAPEAQGDKGADKQAPPEQNPGGTPGVPNVPQAKGNGMAARFMPGPPNPQ